MTMIGQADFDIVAGMMPVMAVLEQIGARAAVTGSLAAVAHGLGRIVSDIDIVADLSPEQLLKLATRLGSSYAVDTDMGAAALAARTAFPIVELGMLLKIDILVPRDRALDHAALERARPTRLAPDLPLLPLLTPEDLILFKLERAAVIWPHRDRDWYDLLWLLKFRRDLDQAYLDTQAATMGWTRGLITARAAAQHEPLAMDVALADEQMMLQAAWSHQQPASARVEGARLDRIQGVAFERRRDRERDPTVDELTLALTAFKWRFWDSNNPAASERLVTLVRSRVDTETVHVP
jgi:hypothetical protein